MLTLLLVRCRHAVDAELAEHGSLFYQLDHLRHDVIVRAVSRY